MVHIATKLRNFLLKTKNQKKKAFGEKYFIRINHLYELMSKFRKDEHQLTETILNPADKQNFQSVLRLCDSKVTQLLKSSVKDSLGTATFLEILRDIVESYMNCDLSPLERIRKIWYALFMLRIWREYILSHETFTLKADFLSANCYTCVELNAHSLVLCIMHLRDLKMTHLFLPHLFGSQQCEALFRQIRSFSSTYSTVANCSVKEILGRISKIQLQSDTTNNISSCFNFPRLKSSFADRYNIKIEMPTNKEISDEIAKCQKAAIKKSIQIGLSKQTKNASKVFQCAVNPYAPRILKPKLNNEKNNESDAKGEIIQKVMPSFKNIKLKDFSLNSKDKIFDESSPYVEIICEREKKIVVKKTSLCWLLRKDYRKVSSDRLERVKCPIEATKVISKKKKLKRKALKPNVKTTSNSIVIRPL